MKKITLLSTLLAALVSFSATATTTNITVGIGQVMSSFPATAPGSVSLTNLTKVDHETIIFTHSDTRTPPFDSRDKIWYNIGGTWFVKQGTPTGSSIQVKIDNDTGAFVQPVTTPVPVTPELEAQMVHEQIQYTYSIPSIEYKNASGNCAKLIKVDLISQVKWFNVPLATCTP